MKANEILDTVLEFYRNGGRPGITESGICMYYGEDDNQRCGIGAYLPVEVAKELQRDYTGWSIWDVLHESHILDDYYPEDITGIKARYFLSALQKAHDTEALSFSDEPFLSRLQYKLNDLRK